MTLAGVLRLFGVDRDDKAAIVELKSLLRHFDREPLEWLLERYAQKAHLN
jgi:hypothetical protein